MAYTFRLNMKNINICVYPIAAKYHFQLYLLVTLRFTCVCAIPPSGKSHFQSIILLFEIIIVIIIMYLVLLISVIALLNP